MKKDYLSTALKTLTCILFLSALVSCSSNPGNTKETETDSTVVATASQTTESIPDSTVQFLITSAAGDFKNFKQVTPVDFRKVKVGYVELTPGVNSFVLCGEFASKEKKDEWLPFATLKTSGYEQYMGNQALSFCEKATMVLTDETQLSADLKNKLEALRK
ncbi:hypothetical protein [Emticicia sp. C21]|uniref:hypothetical protein n=1 Tax=Emticicia sp. C21 TaxID=2302915 RepID=UPI000E34C72B|nr:hypothetical protein [Emticicia sp. C21]RFS17051.1 hypothetical protein D0T08_10270 [Emticicia sp. C21]